MKDITTEEAVKILRDIPFFEQVENHDVNGPRWILKTNKRLAQARDMVLDLYQKEKEKREEREKRLQEEINEVCKLKTELYGNSISKCKIESKIDILKKALEELEGISECATKYDTTQKLWHQIEILEQILEEE